MDGFYQITSVPPGTYSIVIKTQEYDSIVQAVTVKANEIVTKNFQLKKRIEELEVVEVSAESKKKETEVNISVTTITPKDIEFVPSVGGEADLAQFLQILPGVVFTGDQGGQLYIRGGAPIQNKVLLDGMIVYNPFHSIGLFSVFDNDILRNVDVYTGGFNAEYGGRISSVMDITTRDGNKKRLGGKVSASTFGAKAMLEGPLLKAKDENSSTLSYIVSGKTSYLDKTSPVLYPYADSAGLPFNFLDIYGKISLNSPNGSKMNLFGFSFNDGVKDYKGFADFNWKSLGFGSNFVVVPGSSQTIIKGNFAYSKYGIEMAEEDRRPRTSDIDGFNLGINFIYYRGKDEINYGIEILGFKTDFQFFNSLNRSITQTQNTTEFGSFFKYKYVAKNGKLVLEPGMRLQYYASFPEVSPEPRLGLKANLTKKLRFKAAGGMYSQNLISAISDRDVVNLFYGFLSGPDNLQDEFTTEDGETKEVTSKLQKGWHAIAGFEIDLFKNFEANIETYIKNFNQLTNLNRNKIYDDTPANADKPDFLKNDFIIESGKAYGIDFLFKYEYKRLYLWAVYSLGYVKRWDGFVSYRPHFDRRHNVNLVAAYKFGKDKSWEIDARWNYGSGFPFTPTAGFYENLTFSDGINSDYVTENGDLGVMYGSQNSKPLPDYHRLDLNIKKFWEVSEFSVIEVSAGVTNAYNWENIFYFDRIKYKRVNQLPILPSVSLSWRF